MSNVRAIQAYSNRNPAIRLVGNVIPGSRNFPHTAARILTLAASFAVVAGATQLIGGDWHQVWQVKPLAAMLGLTFVLSTIDHGFRHSFTGYVSAILGTVGGRDADQFNEHIAKHAMKAAHIWALINIVHSMPINMTDLGPSLTPAVLGYLYAVVLGIVLPSRSTKDRPQLMDALIPGVSLVAAYWVFANVLIK